LICFGDVSEEQLNKAQIFVTTLQNDDNSHCIVAQPGENLSDKLIGSEIFGGNGGNPGGIGNLDEEDPDLAAAIRMSLEESQQQAPSIQPQAQQQPIIQAPQPSGKTQP